MTNPRQCVTVNVHHPRVSHIARQDTGILAITLGNGEYAQQVTILTNDSEWLDVTYSVQHFRDTEHPDELSCKYCRYPATDQDDMTEHVFDNHSDKVVCRDEVGPLVGIADPLLRHSFVPDGRGTGENICVAANRETGLCGQSHERHAR